MSSPSSKGRVLVLEDQGTFSGAVEKCFSRDGYTVIQAANSRQFESVVSKRWDIAVLDLAIEPGESSRIQAVSRGPLKIISQAVLDTYCRRIRAVRENSPLCYILVQTAHKPEDAVGKALKEACNAAFADEIVFLPLQDKDNMAVPVHETIKEFSRRASDKHMERRDAMKKALAYTGAKSLIMEGLESTLVKCLMKAQHWPAELPTGEKPRKLLLLGKSGVGKEFLARLIHELSPRRLGQFVTMDCPRITDLMSVSQFFGHRKDSFTGAKSDREGLFHAIDKHKPNCGTAFLDEVDSLPPQAQNMLLRFIETRQLRRLGDESLSDDKLRLIDVCFIAASNRLLDPAWAKQQQFRKDLLFRFQDVVTVPSLDERGEACIKAYVLDFSRRHAVEIDDNVVDLLVNTRYDEKGGFRALERVLDSAFHSRAKALYWLGIDNLDLGEFPWLGNKNSSASSSRAELQRDAENRGAASSSTCSPALKDSREVEAEDHGTSLTAYETETAQWYQDHIARKENADGGASSADFISTSTGDHRKIPVQNSLRVIFENPDTGGEGVLKTMGVQHGSRPWRNVLHEMRISLRDARSLAKRIRQDQKPFRSFIKEYIDKHPECGLQL